MERQNKADNVVDMPARADKVHNFELTFNLGKVAQGRFLTDFPQVSDPRAMAGQLDGLINQARRIQAQADIVEYEESIANAEDQILVWQGDHDEAEHDHRIRVAKLDVAIDERRKQRDILNRDLKQKNAGSGRKTDKLDHQQKRSLDDIDRLIARDEDEKTRLLAERDQALSTLGLNIKNNRRLIDRLRKKIAAKEAFIAGAVG